MANMAQIMEINGHEVSIITESKEKPVIKLEGNRHLLHLCNKRI